MEDAFPTVAVLESGFCDGEREDIGRRWGTLRCRVSERIPSTITLHESAGARDEVTALLRRVV
ncbi:hypothetical protein BDN71DRAFT_1451469 [Pleurotus eryngii]|uniref:Uncharacterized protein n=1 Tax=Pleurotus eryngii TaxID=5323 RepID=A0A9P5ZUE9_PLEER|nr:hypothetical protein BDN71DRAFT_1451469 [Pleurotus eryngii]